MDFYHASFIPIAFTAITSLVIAVLSFAKLSSELRVLAFFTLYTILNDVILIYCAQHGINNSAFINTFTLVEYGALTYIFVRILREIKIIQVLMTIVVLGWITAVIITFQRPFSETVNGKSVAIESIAFICLSLLYFYRMLDKMEHESPFDDPLFWFNSAILLYFAGAFFFFIFSGSSGIIEIWYIHIAVRFIFNLLILITFWKAHKVQISY